MNYRKISTDRQFKDATGYNRSSFENLLFDFTSTYFDLNGQSYEDYLEENVQQEPKLKTLGDALFFVLFQMKNDLIFGSLGVVFDMSASSALNNFNYFSELVTIQPVYQSPQTKFDTNGSVWPVKSFFMASKAEYPCLVAVDKKALIRKKRLPVSML